MDNAGFHKTQDVKKEIQKNNIQTLSKIKKNENGLWEVLIPNIQLIMQ